MFANVSRGRGSAITPSGHARGDSSLGTPRPYGPLPLAGRSRPFTKDGHHGREGSAVLEGERLWRSRGSPRQSREVISSWVFFSAARLRSRFRRVAAFARSLSATALRSRFLTPPSSDRIGRGDPRTVARQEPRTRRVASCLRTASYCAWLDRDSGGLSMFVTMVEASPTTRPSAVMERSSLRAARPPPPLSSRRRI